MKIAVAVSGGADSLFALLTLIAQGHEVTALHARLAPLPEDPVPGLTEFCARLGVPLHVAELGDVFQRDVVAPFVAEHIAARTPNPCALCNRAVKFGALLDLALNTGAGGIGAEALATGHYAAMEDHPVYGLTLRAGADVAKDQSYFLALTSARRLRRCVFPLAGQIKARILRLLERRNVRPPLPRESQEICFVPNDDHLAFLLASGAVLPGPGPVLLVERDGSEREIGRHQGLWRYTEGQRKGLGIAWSEPLFVLRRDTARNALVVGGRYAALSTDCAASDVNLMVPPVFWPEHVFARTRYRQKPAPATATMEGDRLMVCFADPQAPAAPGQVLAVYDAEGFVLAGGVVE